MQDKQIDFRPTAPRGVGSVVGFSLLALLLGAANILWLPFSVMLPMPCVMLVMIMAAVLWEKAGPVPGVVMVVVGVVVAMLFGVATTAFVLLAEVVPAALAIYFMKKERPFDRTMRVVMIAALLGVAVAASVAVGLYGRDVVADTMAEYRDVMETQMSNYWRSTLSAMTAAGYDVSGYSLASFTSDMDEVLGLMTLYYQNNLLANLLTGSLLSAMLTVFWASWVRAKQGRVTAESFKGLADWRMPDDLAIGLALMLIAGLVLSVTNIQGIGKVNTIVGGACKLMFTVAAYARIDARGREMGQSVARRRLRIILMTIAGLICGSILNGFGLFGIYACFGAYEALFGKQGAFRHKNRNENE